MTAEESKLYESIRHATVDTREVIKRRFYTKVEQIGVFCTTLRRYLSQSNMKEAGVNWLCNPRNWAGIGILESERMPHFVWDQGKCHFYHHNYIKKNVKSWGQTRFRVGHERYEQIMIENKRAAFIVKQAANQSGEAERDQIAATFNDMRTGLSEMSVLTEQLRKLNNAADIVVSGLCQVAESLEPALGE